MEQRPLAVLERERRDIRRKTDGRQREDGIEEMQAGRETSGFSAQRSKERRKLPRAQRSPGADCRAETERAPAGER